MVGAYGQKENRPNGTETGRMIGGKGDFEKGGENRRVLARAYPVKKQRNLMYRGNRGGGYFIPPSHPPGANLEKVAKMGHFRRFFTPKSPRKWRFSAVFAPNSGDFTPNSPPDYPVRGV